jgi:hypothetical protein
MRRFMLVLLAACASAAPKPEAAAPEIFQATLDSGSEVPPPKVDAQPSGKATFTVAGATIVYKVSADGLGSAFTMAHIHAGAPGTAGPVVVPLQLAATPGGASGEGTIDAAAIKGKRADGSPMTMDDLLAALRSGGLYVNVHTANNKAGEVRGQIKP